MFGSLKRFLYRSGLIVPAWKLAAMTSSARRKSLLEATARLESLTKGVGAEYAEAVRSMPAAKTALVIGMHDPLSIALQSPLLLAFRMAGYRPAILLSSPDSSVLETYRLFGVDAFVFFGKYLQGPAAHPAFPEMSREIRDVTTLKELEYRGARVGKYVLSSYIRKTRNGDPKPSDLEMRNSILPELSNGLAYTDAVADILADVKPDAALLIDIGYSPNGQVFDLCVEQGIPCITWNSSHRDGALTLKRYTRENRSVHPASLSKATWNAIAAMPWSDALRERTLAEMRHCYKSGQWFSGVGTQVNKKFPDARTLRRVLGLDERRKTAVIFPHIFWDSTFFWGEDLFRNYEHWFRETLRAAAANANLNWIIKIHPANRVKNARDGYSGIGSEEKAIRETLGELPSHVTVLDADSDVATLALFDVMDYCVTVRGTVGIEAALFGVRVVTAGTGRYDRFGFTKDARTPEEYLDTLSRLQDLAPMSDEEITLASRFAYGLFVSRPARLTGLTYRFRQDESATLEIQFKGAPGAGLAQNREIREIASWLDGVEEDFVAPESLDR